MKKKKTIIVSIITIVLIAVYFLLFYNKSNNQDKIIVSLKNDYLIFEYGEEVYLNVDEILSSSSEKYIISTDEESIIFENNVALTINEENLSVGKYDFYFENDESLKFSVEVVDSIAPEIIVEEIIVVQKNPEDFDLELYFEIVELSDYSISYTNEYDVAMEGEYEIIVNVADEYNNAYEKTILLKVIEVYDEELLTKTKQGTFFETKEDEAQGNDIILEEYEVVQETVDEKKYTEETIVETEEGFYVEDVASSYYNQINEYRAQNGLSILERSEEAQAEADARALEISVNYEHNASFGYGENIGYGSVGTDFFTAWKESYLHNSAMLREQNVSMGVSVYQINDLWYAVVSFEMNY